MNTMPETDKPIDDPAVEHGRSGRRYLRSNDFRRLPGHCHCGKPIPPKSRRRKTCSEACAEQKQLLCFWSMQKSRAEKRDHRVCQICGFDMGKVRRIVEHGMYLPGTFDWVRFVSSDARRWLRGIIGSWEPEVDHILPVVEGGGVRPDMTVDQVLANLRTLCQKCHQQETRALAARRAKQRRDAKPLPLLEGVTG